MVLLPLSFSNFFFQTFFEKLSMVHGIEILKTDFDVMQFVSNCEVTYSKDSLNYQSTNVC